MSESNPAADGNELLRLTRALLQALGEGDWEAYRRLCDPTLTSFEPEAAGQLVEGLDFHRFYFERGGMGGTQTTICSPHVRVLGDSGIVCYVRLLQRNSREGLAQTQAFEETRVWQRQDGHWRHVHFHRSALKGWTSSE